MAGTAIAGMSLSSPQTICGQARLVFQKDELLVGGIKTRGNEALLHLKVRLRSGGSQTFPGGPKLPMVGSFDASFSVCCRCQSSGSLHALWRNRNTGSKGKREVRASSGYGDSNGAGSGGSEEAQVGTNPPLQFTDFCKTQAVHWQEERLLCQFCRSLSHGWWRQALPSCMKHCSPRRILLNHILLSPAQNALTDSLLGQPYGRVCLGCTVPRVFS